MRNVWAGLTLAAGLFLGVTFAQNAQPNNQGTQPGAAGQKQGEPAGQGQTRPGQVGQQPQAGGVIQPGQAGQTGQQRQQGQFTPGGQQAAGGEKQIGEQCLASVKQELGAKQGIDLDKCFMGQQIGAHLKVVDELKVLRNYASGQLRETLDKELQMAQTHLQQAKQIEQQLKDRPSERVSRRPESK